MHKWAIAYINVLNVCYGFKDKKLKPHSPTSKMNQHIYTSIVEFSSEQITFVTLLPIIHTPFSIPQLR